MHEKKLILWKYHPSSDFDNGWTPKDRKDGVGFGGHLHSKLEELILFCRIRCSEPMSIARIECKESEVTPIPQIGHGWFQYISEETTYSEEGFMPLEEAEKKYLG